MATAFPLPLGTTMSARRMVGWMYWSNAGFTNLLYCLMTPSMSRPRSLMSRRSRRTRRMSESVSTKIFMSRSSSSDLSAKAMMPSKMMTLAPYSVFQSFLRLCVVKS